VAELGVGEESELLHRTFADLLRHNAGRTANIMRQVSKRSCRDCRAARARRHLGFDTSHTTRSVRPCPSVPTPARRRESNENERHETDRWCPEVVPRSFGCVLQRKSEQCA
jgi:hypothetical protein